MNNRLVAAALSSLFVLFLTNLSLVPGVLAQQQPPEALPQASSSQNAPADPASLSPRELTLERAKIYMATKRYQESIHEYQELLKTDPRNALYMNMIGICYLNLSDLNQSRKYFERSAKADRKYSSPVNNLGMIWYQQKSFKKAIRQYQRALAIDPGQAGVYANLGYAYYNTKKFSEAATAFRKALEINPRAFERSDRVGTMMQDRTVSNKGMFYYMMAREYAQLGNLEQCADYLRRSFDEGYPEAAKARTDSAFAKVLNDPGIQDVMQRISPLPAAPSN